MIIVMIFSLKLVYRLVVVGISPSEFLLENFIVFFFFNIDLFIYLFFFTKRKNERQSKKCFSIDKIYTVKIFCKVRNLTTSHCYPYFSALS